MTKTSFNRDGILTNDERVASARKCLSLLDGETLRMTDREREFVESMENNIVGDFVSERQLAWLRDLVSRYST